MESHFDQLDEIMEKTRETNRCLAGMLHGAQQPRLAKEVDVLPDTKTRKRMEDDAAERVISGDSSSAQLDSNPMCLTSFGDDSTGPPALPCSRYDGLVDKDAAASKPCLSPAEMRTLTAADGLQLAGPASTSTRTIFHQPSLLFCPTEEINLRTSIQYATYSSFWKMKVLET